MNKTESIYKVTYRLTPKATILRTEYVKAYDHDHAMRIAKRLWGIRGRVEKVELAFPTMMVGGSAYERKRLEERRSP